MEFIFFFLGGYNREYYVRARHRRLQAASRRWPRAALLLVLNYRTMRTLIQHMHPLICNIWPIMICATVDRTGKNANTHRNEKSRSDIRIRQHNSSPTRNTPETAETKSATAATRFFLFVRLFCICVSTRHTAEPSCTGSSRCSEAFFSSRSSLCPPPPEFTLCGRSASRHFRMHHIVVGE